MTEKYMYENQQKCLISNASEAKSVFCLQEIWQKSAAEWGEFWQIKTSRKCFGFARNVVKWDFLSEIKYFCTLKTLC